MFEFGTPGSNQGINWANTAANYGANLNFQPGQFSYNQISPQDLMGSGIHDALRNRFMNPYIQGVVENQKSGAILDYNRQRNDRNAGYVKAGAFGGSRQAVADYLGEEGLHNRLDSITKQGYSNAFDTASRQAMEAQGFNIEALMRGDTETGQRFMEAQGMQEQARQRAAELGLSGADLSLRGGAAMSDIEKQRQALLYEQIKQMAGVGADYDQLTQAGLDLGYQDFVNQRDYPRQNLSWLSGILHGVPVSNNQAVSEMQARNPISQLLGLGIAGAGLYNMINTPQPGTQAT
jgi:hypothetical protein